MYRQLQLSGDKPVMKSSKFKVQSSKLLYPIPYTLYPNSGFTLIELLISIVIITILMSVSFAGYARLNQRQTVITAGQNLKNTIRDAQSRANNSEVDCRPSKCNCALASDIQFNGWYVDFSTKKIYGQCGATNFGDKDFGLSTEVVITPFVTPINQLIFKNNPPSVSGKSTICISNPNLSSSFYVIRVNESGSISDDGGLVSSCTP